MAPRLTFTPELKANVRRRYEETDESMDSLAADLKVHPRTLRDYVHEWGWTPRSQRPPRDLSPLMRDLGEAQGLLAELSARKDDTRVIARSSQGDEAIQSGDAEQEEGAEGWIASLPAAPATCNDASSPPSPPPLTASPEQRTLDLIDRLQNQVDQTLTTVERMQAQHDPRLHRPAESEQLSRTLELLTRTLKDVVQLRFAASSQATTNDDDDFPRDIDEFRRELARRIDAFVASRTEPGIRGGEADAAGDGAAGP